MVFHLIVQAACKLSPEPVAPRCSRFNLVLGPVVARGLLGKLRWKSTINIVRHEEHGGQNQAARKDKHEERRHHARYAVDVRWHAKHEGDVQHFAEPHQLNLRVGHAKVADVARQARHCFLHVGDLGRKPQERKQNPHVEMLVPVEPRERLFVRETQDGKQIEHILVELRVIAVRVVAHEMVVSPLQARLSNRDIARDEPQNGIQKAGAGKPAMVGGVLNAHASPVSG
mmetsp:Transcript_28476/g.93037  ORF Transcript_28476/g.93037 Transcript_28476/m.93037 type:complete len:228 (-) Transcript_28476:542-1225(-)